MGKEGQALHHIDQAGDQSKVKAIGCKCIGFRILPGHAPGGVWLQAGKRGYRRSGVSAGGPLIPSQYPPSFSPSCWGMSTGPETTQPPAKGC
eukprot:3986862-Pyramimonas_sp.AAC.1